MFVTSARIGCIRWLFPSPTVDGTSQFEAFRDAGRNWSGMVGVEGISTSLSEGARDLDDDLEEVNRRVKLFLFFWGFSDAFSGA